MGRGTIDGGEGGVFGRGVAHWVRQAEREAAGQPRRTTADSERLQQLERENRELRRANEILRKASAYFAQAELDRRGT